jgi:hypothetical protein
VTPPAAAAAPVLRSTDRVVGHPARGAGSAGRASAIPRRPLTVAPRPRRVSGPARRQDAERAARRRSGEGAGIALGLVEALGRLSEHRLLDRLIRGRTWIALVAFALIGIVTLQLGLLKLNAGIGHALAREALLQRENAALSIENSELAAGDRIESSAARAGMEVVPAGALRFLGARPHLDASRAASALRTPVSSPTSTTGEASSAAPASGSSTPASGSTTSSEPGPASSGESQTASHAPAAEAATPSSGESALSSPASVAPSGERSAPAGPAASATAPTSAGGSTEASPAGGTAAGPSG